MANFVLVHGAWHGGWCYRRVARILRAAGHEVFTPTLTGLGERSHLLREDTDLDTHIADVANVIAWENLDEVVLCGHSYGGIVVTGVADVMAVRLKAVVYLDAFLPEDGQSTLDLLDKDRAAQLVRETRAGDGMSVAAPDVSMYGVNSKDEAWVREKVTSHPLASFQQPIRLTGEHRKPRRIFVYAAGEEISRPYYERCLQDPTWEVFVTEMGGHDQMIDDPVTVADILMQAAQP